MEHTQESTNVHVKPVEKQVVIIDRPAQGERPITAIPRQRGASIPSPRPTSSPIPFAEPTVNPNEKSENENEAVAVMKPRKQENRVTYMANATVPKRPSSATIHRKVEQSVNTSLKGQRPRSASVQRPKTNTSSKSIELGTKVKRKELGKSTTTPRTFSPKPQLSQRANAFTENYKTQTKKPKTKSNKSQSHRKDTKLKGISRNTRTVKDEISWHDLFSLSSPTRLQYLVKKADETFSRFQERVKRIDVSDRESSRYKAAVVDMMTEKLRNIHHIYDNVNLLHDAVKFEYEREEKEFGNLANNMTRQRNRKKFFSYPASSSSYELQKHAEQEKEDEFSDISRISKSSETKRLSTQSRESEEFDRKSTQNELEHVEDDFDNPLEVVVQKGSRNISGQSIDISNFDKKKVKENLDKVKNSRGVVIINQ